MLTTGRVWGHLGRNPHGMEGSLLAKSRAVLLRMGRCGVAGTASGCQIKAYLLCPNPLVWLQKELQQSRLSLPRDFRGDFCCSCSRSLMFQPCNVTPAHSLGSCLPCCKPAHKAGCGNMGQLESGGRKAGLGDRGVAEESSAGCEVLVMHPSPAADQVVNISFWSLKPAAFPHSVSASAWWEPCRVFWPHPHTCRW